MTEKIKSVNSKTFLAFQIQIGFFLNFCKIKQTASYQLFLIKIVEDSVENPLLNAERGSDYCEVTERSIYMEL